MGKIKSKNGFALAETMIVLIVLGVIAAITVPALIRRQVDIANRTKIRKAMTVYDSTLNKMVIENGIKDNSTLTSFAGNASNNCSGSASYFKQVEGSGCEFKTSDGVWWNISDITHPYIAFKKEDLTETNAAASDNKKAYYLVGRFDDENGILRVDDLQYETSANNTTEQGYLAKLYGQESVSISEFMQNCTIVDESHCKIGNTTYTKVSIKDDSVSKDVYGDELCIWDSNTEKQSCPYISQTSDKDLYIAYVTSSWTTYEKAKAQCAAQNARLATMAELSSMQKNGLIQSCNGCDYWSSDEYNKDYAYGVLNGSDGTRWYKHSRTGSRYRALCVGN